MKYQTENIVLATSVGAVSINNKRDVVWFVTRSRPDDDLVDQFSHQFSPTLFLLFSIVVSVKQYVTSDVKTTAVRDVRRQDGHIV